MNIPSETFEVLRKKLLDLSNRNRLLNFSHGRGNFIRVIDELPDQLNETLLAEGEMRFIPVPDDGIPGYTRENGGKKPSAEEWAKRLGLNPSFEMPKPGNSPIPSKHQDKAIQTLLFPKDLEARLRNIANKAETAIQETGANILYLTFGFLQWFESEESEIPRYAPLYLMPCKLNKGKLDRETKTFIYTLNYSGEDIDPNLSLNEKLRNDFNIDFPGINGDTTPESYFSEINDLLSKIKPRWKVFRFITLSLLNFGKLRIYLDLDPINWPKGASITEHPIVGQILGANPGCEPPLGGFSEEYEIDSIPEIHEKFPLIYDADSSQHSAIIDTLSGKNLVIEGPPGTGKSQTITNLIAAAIAQGKKVLFVAEKLAALEVVKNRLEKAGLGDFCLELHSHKTQKRRVLEEIKKRLDLNKIQINQNTIDVEISRYETLKEKLNKYSRIINRPWKNTGMTIHQLFMRATKLRLEIKISPELLHPTSISGENFNIQVQYEGLDQVKTFSHAYETLRKQLGGTQKTFRDHPWFGVRNDNLHVFDCERIFRPLEELQESIFSLRSEIGLANSKFHLNCNEDLSTVTSLISDLNEIPILGGREEFSALLGLRGEERINFQNLLEEFKKVQTFFQVNSEVIRKSALDNLAFINDLPKVLHLFNLLNPPGEMLLGDLQFLYEKMNRLMNDYGLISSFLENLKRDFLENNIGPLEEGIEGLEDLEAILTLISSFDPNLLSFRNSLFDEPYLDKLLPEIKEQFETLHSIKSQVEGLFPLESPPTIENLLEIKRKLAKPWFLRLFIPEWWRGRKELFKISGASSASIDKLRGKIDQYVDFIEKKNHLENESGARKFLGDSFRGMDTPIDELIKMRKWYKSIRERFGIGVGPKIAFGQSLINLPGPIFQGFQSLSCKEHLQKIRQILFEYKEIFGSLPNCTISPFSRISLLNEDGFLQRLKIELESGLPPLTKLFAEDQFPMRKLKEILGGLNQISHNRERIVKLESPNFFPTNTVKLKLGLNQSNENSLEIIEQTLVLAKHIETKVKLSLVRDALFVNSSAVKCQSLKILGRNLNSLMEKFDAASQRFFEISKQSLEDWFGADSNFEKMCHRNEFAISNKAWLNNWLDFLGNRRELISMGFQGLIDALETENLKPDDLEKGYHLGSFDLISREVFREIPEISMFAGYTQTAIQKQFSDYDEKLKDLQRQKVAFKASQNSIPTGNTGRKVSELSDLLLLRRECEKKKKHIPIRQLVKRAGNALAALKPCFMMGPMSVAQYLPPGEIQFNLVVMDEASQIKPEEALGAVARGGQLVVVGDPKQLPPTTFFEKQWDDQEDEEEEALDGFESILDGVLRIFSKRRLRWHYRSRHESLIAFSNHHFYDQDLIVFPAPFLGSKNLGVHLEKISHGCFVDRKNVEEAKAIARFVQKELLANPAVSIGIAAMNIPQRDEIEIEIEKISKEDARFQEALTQNGEAREPLFIKNLENVQGDERDLILISMTYGPPVKDGPVPQRFGPILGQNGWRRLNVLFTRAKNSMRVFSSISSADIDLKIGSSKGVVALKDFLAFAETGQLSKSPNQGRAPDSDFEVAVAAILREKGFECTYQVGVEGYFIDLGVSHFSEPGIYIMGIECDGATYHSAKSARDRDRLRRQVLESLGWQIRRIWSTDWFKNPEATIKPIIDELHEMVTNFEKRPVSPPAPEMTISNYEEELFSFQNRSNFKGGKILIERCGQNQYTIKEVYPENVSIIKKSLVDLEIALAAGKSL